MNYSWIIYHFRIAVLASVVCWLLFTLHYVIIMFYNALYFLIEKFYQAVFYLSTVFASKDRPAAPRRALNRELAMVWSLKKWFANTPPWLSWRTWFRVRPDAVYGQFFFEGVRRTALCWHGAGERESGQSTPSVILRLTLRYTARDGTRCRHQSSAAWVSCDLQEEESSDARSA